MFDFVFVVLTYHNTADLEMFFEKNVIKNSKVIVVNSYFDDDSLEEFRRIAIENNAIFIPIENLGYSYGNNIGIEYAKENLQFEYLIVSNADVEVLDFDSKFLLEKCSRLGVYGPTIITLDNKQQNPYIVRYKKIMRSIFYLACKKRLKYLKYFVFLLNKIDRVLFLQTVKSSSKPLHKVYSCHGSFIIVGREAIDLNFNFFNNQMFLFNEEHFFAKQCKLNNVPIFYLKDRVSIKHYEDGSVSSISSKINQLSDESYIVYYKYFNK